MKLSLLALAVAAALPAFAHAHTNIVLNGSIDQSLEYIDPDVAGVDSDVRVTNGVWSGSRFAISGTEELGGGLKGIFNIEHRLSPDTGTVTSGATFWAGQAWVGLQGGFGAIRMGRQYTPMFRALAPGDVTGYSWYNNPVGLAGTAIRFNNDLTYQSPSLAGFTLHAAYAAGEGDPALTGLPGAAGTTVVPGDVDVGDAVGVAAVGAFGPLNFGLGYHKIFVGDVIPGADDTDELGASLGAKFGNFGVGLLYAQKEINSFKTKAAAVTGSAGFGPGTVYLVLKRTEFDDTDLTNDGIGLTYSHGLSKRTFVYASVGLNKVEVASGDDIKPKAFALGIRHFF
jgi:predicted porin